MEKDLTSELLEDVFNEIDTQEELENVPKKPGFLEDVVNSEINMILNDKKTDKNKETNNSNENTSINIEDIDSLIHQGLTDSSDDEENKYFEESKYNECGKSIKQLLKDKNAGSNSLFSGEKAHVKGKDFAVNARLARDQLKQHLNALAGTNTSKLETGDSETKKPSTLEKGNLLVDPILNMRIINPLVSSTTLKEKMLGRISIGTLKIKTFLNSASSKSTDWVTGGAIVNKLLKTSQKGNQYCIWRISDLMGDIKTISVFLFGSAYTDFWKTATGTIVGILNPDVMDGNEKSEATLRVDNAHKILLMGTSKDYGTCKSKKKNGENCSSVVNTGKCEFCSYHLQKEYSKACRRSDLQPPKMGSNMDKLKRKFFGKNQGFTGSKGFTGVRGKKSVKNLEKDRQMLLSLSQAPGQSNSSPGNFQKSALTINNSVRSVMEKPKPQTVIPSPKQEPRMIDLDFSITKKDRNAAKQRALNYVRKNGPIRKVVENERGKRTPEQIASLKRKLEAEEETTSKKHKDSNVAEGGQDDTKKKKLERIGMNDKFFQLMNAGVKNMEILKTAENDQQEKYFNKLETRERMEDKMASTFKIECNAVRCLKCHYKAFSASDLCKREKHPIKVFKAIKRFWKCAKCSARTVSLELVPVHPCKTCGNSSWEKTSMMPEKGPNLTVEPLSIRGMEEKFIGSVAKNANLNLMVPESAS
ncbi:hypothetical protein RUM44_012392 [Polyplax serrata]|uniref:Protein MCM10 homolog n=1 Tax=Polyplax serrata TaxID=468196 RepID=A0ABR1BB62_POLSC